MGIGGGDPFDERWVRPAGDGRFEMTLPSGVRAMLLDLVGRLEELLRSDADVVRRVFPTAYPEDAEKEAGFQSLVRGELIDRHVASAAVIVETIHGDVLTEPELTSWMTALNALRLVFGTALDVSEDEEPDHDPDSEDAPARLAYHVLGELVDDIVHALRTTL